MKSLLLFLLLSMPIHGNFKVKHFKSHEDLTETVNKFIKGKKVKEIKYSSSSIKSNLSSLWYMNYSALVVYEE